MRKVKQKVSYPICIHHSDPASQDNLLSDFWILCFHSSKKLPEIKFEVECFLERIKIIIQLTHD